MVFILIRSSSKAGDKKTKSKGTTGLSHSLFGSESYDDDNDDFFTNKDDKKVLLVLCGIKIPSNF